MVGRTEETDPHLNARSERFSRVGNHRQEKITTTDRRLPRPFQGFRWDLERTLCDRRILTFTPWAAPRICRWGYKTGFASGASGKFFFVPPTFPNVGVQASKYQQGPIEYIEICRLVVALIILNTIGLGRPRPMVLRIRERDSSVMARLVS